jgi:natural product precursor
VKKTVKKLTLNRETLRNLNEEQLENIGGGAVVKSKQYSECPDLSCGFACTAINCVVE